MVYSQKNLEIRTIIVKISKNQLIKKEKIYLKEKIIQLSKYF